MGDLAEPGFVIWLTGLPAAGKTSLARELQRLLAGEAIQTVILDSDDLRRVLTPAPRYTEEERDWFYAVLVHLAAWLAGSGVNVLLAATAHRQSYRQQARDRIARFAEVYVRCPLELCRQRDPKGIYALAEAGQAGSVPGVGVAYQEPEAPEAEVDTALLSPTEAAAAIIRQLSKRGWWEPCD